LGPYSTSVIRAHIRDKNWDYIKPLLYDERINWKYVISTRSIAEYMAPYIEDKDHYVHTVLSKEPPPEISPEEILAETPNDFHALVQLKQYEKAKQLYEEKRHTNGKSWQYAQLLSLMGKEDDVIKTNDKVPNSNAGTTKIKAYISKALRLWLAGKKDKARDVFAAARAYQGMYLDDYRAYLVIPLFVEWFDHKDTDQLRRELLALGEQYKDRYNNKLLHRMRYLTGEIDRETLISLHPIRYSSWPGDKPDYLTLVMRSIMVGDYNKALEYIQQINLSYDSDIRLFNELCTEKLTEMVNE
jgi:hypothetical protein